jgi:hypothetical protein
MEPSLGEMVLDDGGTRSLIALFYMFNDDACISRSRRDGRRDAERMICKVSGDPK